jgi:TP53 regulating kinase and related kinases
MGEEIISIGAEAVILDFGEKIKKRRLKKSYRHEEIDDKIRRQRTRREARIIGKVSSLIKVPEIFEVVDKDREIIMEKIEGKKLSEWLEKVDYERVCEKIGKSIALLHDFGVVHGDLTTSNMILKNDEVYFIDFGLGFHSQRIEDKAVELHLIKQALEAKHSEIFEKAFSQVLRGYEKSENFEEVVKRLDKVEKRGRYKEQY